MFIGNEKVLRTIFTLKGDFKKKKLKCHKRSGVIEIAKYKSDSNSVVTISADFELAWAFRGRTNNYRIEKAINGRRNIPFILQICNELNIPITWATVGHLFLSSCESKAGKRHPNMPRPPINNKWDGDWYVHDPSSNYTQDPYWYAPDLIEMIMGSKVKHEIGTHSFSHIDFSENTSNEALVSAEIEKCIKVMKPFGLIPRSIVFPFNHMGDKYFSILYQMGIIAVRYRDTKYRLIQPEKTAEGLYKIFESMNLRRPKHYQYKTKAELFIQEAIKSRGAYHLWFHPSEPRSLFEKELKNILEIIKTYSLKGSIWNTTMKELSFLL